MTTKALLTWAYDGSGIALRIPVEVVSTSDGQHRVLFETTDVDIIANLGRVGTLLELSDNRYMVWVPQWSLTAVGSMAPTEPWNWND